jgi:hypothetical protein
MAAKKGKTKTPKGMKLKNLKGKVSGAELDAVRGGWSAEEHVSLTDRKPIGDQAYPSSGAATKA